MRDLERMKKAQKPRGQVLPMVRPKENQPKYVFAFCSLSALCCGNGQPWATVTVTDSEGRRHSVDVYAASTYVAAHLFIVHAKGDPWILKQRQERKGRPGFCFRKGRRWSKSRRKSPS